MPRSSMAPLARSMAIMDHIMAPDTATNMGKKAPSPAVATPWGRARLPTPMDIMRATIIIWAKGAFGSPAWRSGCPMAGGVLVVRCPQALHFERHRVGARALEFGLALRSTL